jgi:hypothetical protein
VKKVLTRCDVGYQIPAYRLPEVSYPVSTMMKGWIREISSMTLLEVLQNANNAIARAELEDQRGESDRESQNSEAEELLDFQTALAIAAEVCRTSWKPNQNSGLSSRALLGSRSGYAHLAQSLLYCSPVS